MKRIILFLFILSLTGCGLLQSNPFDVNTVKQGFSSFATLSSTGNAIEQASSVVYTDLARYRYRAANLRQQRRISLGDAKAALYISDDIRERLERAIKKRQLKTIKLLKSEVNQAVIKLESAL